MPAKSLWIFLFALAGLVILLCFFSLLAISPAFHTEIPRIQRPTHWLVVLLFVSGIAYLAAIAPLKKWTAPPHQPYRARRGPIIAVITLGLFMRLLMVPSTPMFETDFYRYLLDGAIVANGYNPYRFTPSEIEEPVADDAESIREKIGKNPKADDVLGQINHPHLTTIYPPAAQLAFALAHLIEPWSTSSWKAVLALFDLVTLVILLHLLARLKRPSAWVFLYWCNPLLVKESYNSMHMDLILAPFLLGALGLIASRRYLALIFLGIATCVKLWPAILLPLFVRRGKLAMRDSGIFVAVVCLICSPLLFTAWHQGVEGAGLSAFAQGWKMNDALFMALQMAVTEEIARILIVLFVVFVALFMAKEDPNDDIDFLRRVRIVICTLLIVNPTQFPWYFLWVLPILCLSPLISLLAYTAMLPLYYLRFQMKAYGYATYFDHGVVWLEHGVIWLLLLLEAQKPEWFRKLSLVKTSSHQS